MNLNCCIALLFLSLSVLREFLLQSYVKEPFKVRRELLRSSLNELEGVSLVFMLFERHSYSGRVYEIEK